MPSLLGRKNIDTVTEYEKPGRVAAQTIITIEDILESKSVIPVFSGNVELGKISV